MRGDRSTLVPMSRRALVLLVAVVAALGACASSTYQSPDAGDDDGDGGVDPIDAGVDATDASACVRQPCDILSQCGCEGTPSTPVCDLDFTMLATGATRCRANNFGGTEITTRTMAATCGPGHVCVGGRCRKYCGNDDDCAGPGGLCMIELTQGNPPMPIPDAPETCSTDCVPTQAANATCPAGWACHIFLDDPTPGTAGDERYLTDCSAPPASGGGVGATCSGNSSCQPGLDCVNLNPGGPQCRPTCLCPGGNCAAGTCPGGSGSCRGYTTPVVIGTTTYGACF